MSAEQEPINWAGLAIIRNRRLLTIMESDKPFQLIPGGKQEQGESDEETALREIMEELGVLAVIYDEVATITEVSKSTSQLFRFRVFAGKLLSEPQLNNLPGKTVNVSFINSNYEAEGYNVGNLPKLLLPMLVGRGLID